MKDYKVDYINGRNDNTKRLQKQLANCGLFEFGKKSAIKTMISIAITTDYQETMAQIERNEMERNGMIMSCSGSINDMSKFKIPNCTN